MQEIWKDIKGYEGYYQVSNLGRIKSLERTVYYINGKIKCFKSKIRKLCYAGGYLTVELSKQDRNIQRKIFYVHRLVAQAFLPNPEKLPEVNHKDEDKTNNVVWINDDGSIDYEKSNLEWCTSLYNNHYGQRLEKSLKTREINGKRNKPILQYNLSGDCVKEWKSATIVEKECGYSQGHISSCCCNKRKTAYGYIWKFKETA